MLVLVQRQGLVVRIGGWSPGVLRHVGGRVLPCLDLLLQLRLGNKVRSWELMVRDVGDVLHTPMLRTLLESRVLRPHSSLVGHHVEHLLLDGLRTVVLGDTGRVA
jgi:hypothetical protein